MTSEPRPACTVDGCGRPRKTARGLCPTHDARMRRHGTTAPPDSIPLPRAELVRLRRLVGLPDDGPDEATVRRWKRDEAHP